MRVKLFLLITGMTLIGFPKTNAQDNFVAVNPQEEAIKESSLSINQSLNYRKPKRSNDFAVGAHLTYNPNKLGTGIKLSYNFTDMLRFTLDGNYYFHTNADRKFKTITLAGEKGENSFGRHFDINPNLNIVFGDGNFHFYIIGGIYFSYGYNELVNALNGDWYATPTYDADGNPWYDTYAVINGETYYISEELVPAIGLGLNLGCGIEYQITDEIRANLEQQLSLGLMTSWMAKLGIAYCF